MCGFTGYISQQGNVDAAICEKMAKSLQHRGPDDSGVWIDHQDGVALGHRRLSIQDLSSLGRQPMLSSSGRFVIAFNGEIYNFLVLRKELEGLGIRFYGNSDTEVLLAAIEIWGVENSLKRLVGMFAFALWDKKKKTLTLARDRLGEKPLYYGWQNDNFLFGSELKALRQHPSFSGQLDLNALGRYLQYNYVPAPKTIYAGVNKLVPGSYVQIAPLSVNPGSPLEPIAYWQLEQVIRSGIENPFTGKDTEAVEGLNNLLLETIRDKMISDVPLGAFLSGGIDSSTVVALMQATSSRPVKTFTIGFNEGTYNEAAHALRVARYLGTDHTELYVSAEQAMDVIPRLPHIYDEPFADSSQIPSYLVAELAKKNVTVALSGDGGDELFGGYNRHFLAQKWRKVSHIPPLARKVVRSILCGAAPKTWDSLFAIAAPIIPKKYRLNMLGDRLHKFASILPCSNTEELYSVLTSFWLHPEDICPGCGKTHVNYTGQYTWPMNKEPAEEMMFLDTINYLPDDILVKMDRAAMGVSLETRIPFLDHRVVEYAWQLPHTVKLYGAGKWVLRQVLHKYVPQELVERPKMGFGVPIDRWLRGPLRDWAEELLAESRIRREGNLNPIPVRKKWKNTFRVDGTGSTTCGAF
ncbi:MAG: asparagine synthase (glutamine-hydrolyzing) [Desulfofustis sp. PB-SRB1]|nr:asparagine synthase (glutamine-hydrolyzing) [Desulfofustis sp. PB-SRB1]